MLLGFALGAHENELRADLQQFYGIDLDDAAAGAHSAAHVGALVAQMPAGARIRCVENKDEIWTLDATMQAAIFNQINALIYMFGAKKGDKKPQRVGPSWMVDDRATKVQAQIMTIDELRAELSKPRKSFGGE